MVPDKVMLVQVLGMNHAELPADKNKKTKCAVYLRDLQEQARPPLSLAALHHIAAIAGPRYKPPGRLPEDCYFTFPPPGGVFRGGSTLSACKPSCSPENGSQ